MSQKELIAKIIELELTEEELAELKAKAQEIIKRRKWC